MTASPEIHILDVGHGNASIVVADQVCVVDSPRMPQLRDKLRELKIESVDVAVVSHSDVDHLFGIANLLADDTISVSRVCVNSDAQKDTRAWRIFRSTIADARRNRGLKVSSGITTDFDPIQLGSGVSIAVVSPEPENSLSGPGGKDLDGKRIDANTASIVLKVNHENRSRVLLAGDMTGTTLKWIKDCGRDLEADILVFPHHGGLPGRSPPQQFTSDLLELVKPSVVVFSNGRGVHGTPRTEITASILAHTGCAIACTQLSENCAKSQYGMPQDHVHVVSAGRDLSSSCAGSLTFSLSSSVSDSAQLQAHKRFITANVPAALCAPNLEPVTKTSSDSSEPKA